MLHIFVKIIVFILFFYTSKSFSAKISKNDDNFKLIILHNNDMHARFEQTNAFSSRCKEADEKNNKCYGGFARVAHLVRDYRKRADSGEIPKVLYLNAGDTYTGTPWFSIFKDNITATFLDLLKPDAISLGNHEFDEGTENLAKFLREVNFPVLAANLILDEEPELITKNLQPSHVFTIDDTKVGIIGYLTPDTKEVASPNNVEFIDEIEAINKEATKLKGEGVEILIALGHSGLERDKKIARECPDIDLVIGGHSHTFLYTGTPPDIEAPHDDYPVVVVNNHGGRKVPVVQSFAYTKYLGYLHLEFNSEGALVEFDGTPILLDKTVEREKDVLDMLEVYRPAILELQNEIVGKTRVHLDGFCRRRECNLGNLIADSFVHWNALKHNGIGWTDAAIGIIQGGGVRASIEKNNNGITMEDLSTVLPFESKVVVIEISGAKLLEALEHSVHRYTEGEERGEFLQYSGLYVEYNMNQPPGKRVVSAKVLCAYCDVPQLEYINVAQNYRIVLQDFLANGGDGFVMFKDSQIQESETLDAEVFKDYVKNRSPLYPAIEWRILIKDYIDPSQEIIGSTRVFLDGICYGRECNLGNFITDSMIDWYSLSKEVESGWTDASIALIPALNIKHSIDPTVNNGDITRKDAMDILPLNNRIVKVNISGKILIDILEYSIHRFNEGIEAPEFLQMSGLQVEYDLSKSIGSHVISTKALCSSCTVPQLENVDNNNWYNILVPENIAIGGLGYSMLRNSTVETFNTTERDVFINYLNKKSPIYPAVEWRITLLNKNASRDVIGSTRVLLSNDCLLQECNFGNFITDSMVDWYAAYYEGDDGWTDAAIAIMLGSRIKSSISPNNNNGNILRADAEKVFDPPYNLYSVKLKGSDLINLLEYSVSTYGEDNYKELLQMSGIQVSFDMNKPSGNRITDVKVLCSNCFVPELRPIISTEDYKIIVQSSLVFEEYHEVILGNEIKDLNETDINAFLNYLKKKSPIYPSVEWRITIKEKDIFDEITTTTILPPTTTIPPPTTTDSASSLNLSLILLSVSSIFLYLPLIFNNGYIKSFQFMIYF